MPTIRRHSYIAAVLLLLAVACADEPLPTGPDGPLECATPGGRTYSGTIDGSHTWTRADAPHRLMNAVTVGGTLTIEAGALVCGEPGSVITARTLRIDGTQTAPVVLTATDSLAGWGHPGFGL